MAVGRLIRLVPAPAVGPGRERTGVAASVNCPKSHVSQGTRYFCETCGEKLPSSLLPPQAAPTERQGGGSPNKRGGVVGILAFVAGAVVLLVVGIAMKSGSDSGSSQQSTFINQPETNSPRIPPSNQDDWYGAVCRPGTIAPGGGGLHSATLRDACLANGGPIWIGEYNSALMKDNDLARFQGMVHYAEIVDDSGNVWLFVVPVPGRSTALEPLRQFGFTVA